MGLHRSKQKNKSAQSAGPTFSQHFPTQVSPHYIQLDPIYYGFMHRLIMQGILEFGITELNDNTTQPQRPKLLQGMGLLEGKEF